MSNKTSVTHLSNEHNDWLRSLDFYKQELNILKERLTEIAGKNTGEEAEKGFDHYENQLKIQVTNIDTLRHNINENLSKLAQESKEALGHVDKDLISNHDAFRDKVITLENDVNELRHEFNKFAAKWM